MARYVDAIDLPLPIEEAFDYLADFSHTAEWDPGVVESSILTSGQVGLGSRFQVVVSFFGQRMPLEYQITEYDRPTRLVLTGGDASLSSIDEMTFVARPGGTRVTYEARIELVGIRRLADPILEILFQRVGRLAVRGLRERISQDTSAQGASTEDGADASGARDPKSNPGSRARTDPPSGTRAKANTGTRRRQSA